MLNISLILPDILLKPFHKTAGTNFSVKLYVNEHYLHYFPFYSKALEPTITSRNDKGLSVVLEVPNFLTFGADSVSSVSKDYIIKIFITNIYRLLLSLE